MLASLFGQIMTVVPRKSPCLRCFLPETASYLAVLAQYVKARGEEKYPDTWGGVVGQLYVFMAFLFFC